MTSENKADFYTSINKQLAALLTGESNAITNLSQFSAFLNMQLETINWVGFYLIDTADKLLLGPFQGNVACTQIPMGRGVCGKAASEKRSLFVDDVDQFDGHIACDSASRSEIVCPLIVEDKLIGVLDIDSPVTHRFTQEDVKGLELLLETLVAATEFKSMV